MLAAGEGSGSFGAASLSGGTFVARSDREELEEFGKGAGLAERVVDEVDEEICCSFSLVVLSL